MNLVCRFFPLSWMCSYPKEWVRATVLSTLIKDCRHTSWDTRVMQDWCTILFYRELSFCNGSMKRARRCWLRHVASHSRFWYIDDQQLRSSYDFSFYRCSPSWHVAPVRASVLLLCVLDALKEWTAFKYCGSNAAVVQEKRKTVHVFKQFWSHKKAKGTVSTFW